MEKVKHVAATTTPTTVTTDITQRTDSTKRGSNNFILVIEDKLEQHQELINLWVTRFFNIAFFNLMGLAFISIAIIVACGWAILADWGPISNKFIYPACIAAILAGFFVFFTSTLGIVGVMFQQQAEKFEDEAKSQDVRQKFNDFIKESTGHVQFSSRILIAYIVFQFIVILLSIIVTAIVRELYLYYELVANNPSNYKIEDSNTENYLSYIFNNGYFAAASTCANVASNFFWQFINNKCPIGLAQTNCERCYFYSASICQADSFTCYQGNEIGFACPYTICRVGVMTYLYKQLHLLYDLGIAFCIYQMFVILIVIMYLAFHVIEKLECTRKGIKIHYRTEKPIKPSAAMEQIALKRVPFTDEDEDPVPSRPGSPRAAVANPGSPRGASKLFSSFA